MKNEKQLRQMVVVILMLSSLSCSRRVMKATVLAFPVSGVLTYQGQPMSGAVITFYPINSNLTAQGIADGTGKYTLTTHLTNDGAIADQHVVTIHWPVDNRPDSTDDPDPPLPPDRLKQVYTNQKTSELRAEVLKKPNVIDFHLP